MATHKNTNTPNRIIPYNPKLKQIARNLRNNSTLSEILLWNQLKNKRMQGYDFHRQVPVGNYILDFFCNELMLAVEIDGASHEEKCRTDKARQESIEKYGINFLRFQDVEVKKNLEGVVGVIRKWIEDNNPG